MAKHSLLALFLGLILLIGMAAYLPQDVAQAEETKKPFILPFKEPPGPDTWLMAQPYGNTTGAYRQRKTTYRAGQGIHFGVDLSARCGTEIVAIADGVVFAVDNLNFGSGPHNLMVDHPDLGYASFYGHLLERPKLPVGQIVKQGEVIALSGDPAGTCYGRPHLHMEIRDLHHWRKYNPVLLIAADWDNLALIGPFMQAFQRNLDNPRQWQYLDDQPEVVVGGPLLNDFANTWPPGPQPFQPIKSPVAASPTEGRPLSPPGDHRSSPEQTSPTATPPGVAGEGAVTQPLLRQLTQGGCCTQLFWSPDSRQVLFIDKPAPDAPLGIWGVDVTRPDPTPELFTSRIAFYTADLAFLVELSRDTTIIERLADGVRWTVPAAGRQVSISPGHKLIAWQVTNEDLPFERWVTQLWVADLDGSNARRVATLSRGSFVDWVSDDLVLLSKRESLQAREQVLYTLSLTDGRTTELARAEGLRGGLLSPDGSWLAYNVALSPEPADNGLWLVRSDGSTRRKLDSYLFGAYQWRDAHRLLIIPLRLSTVSHEIWQLDVNTDEVRRLTDPQVTTFKIVNGDWAVSPDGQQVAFVCACGAGTGVESRDRNIWLLTLTP